MPLGDVIARLSVSLGLETAAFEKGARKAAKETETLGRKMTRIAGVIGTAFVASIGVDTVRAWADATKGALEYAGSLGETAQQIGATTDELQEYRYVASQVGIEQATMEKGLAKLSVTLGNLASGAAGPTKALERLGFTQEEIARVSRLTAGEALPFLAAKYEALVSPTEKAALAAVFFGSKMGGQFIPLLNEGAEGLQKMRDAAHELGIVISEEAIKNADANADLIATYEQIAAAQKNAALTVPENVRAYVAYQKAVTDLEIGFYKAIVGINNFADATTNALQAFGKASGIQAFFKNFNATMSDWAKRTHDAIVNTIAGIRYFLVDVLGSITTGAIGKIKELGRAFAWLYDVVVGHSYIPDMVDGIAAEMARLDTVMTAQAGKATSATAKKFQDLRDLLDRLFPEVGIHNNFAADRARIEASGLSDAEKSEAFRRLLRELGGRDPSGGSFNAIPDFGEGENPLVEGMGDTEDAIESLTEKAKINTVKIAKSFKDMADETLQSLSRLTNAIKGGSFLDIIGAVADLGLQLAGSGAFGSKVAARVNAIPGHALGTNSAARGLALVGERGPELVSFRGGEKVYNNRETRGMMGGNVYHISGNLLTPEFWARIEAGDLAAADAGARGGVALGQYRQSRRWR